MCCFPQFGKRRHALQDEHVLGLRPAVQLEEALIDAADTQCVTAPFSVNLVEKIPSYVAAVVSVKRMRRQRACLGWVPVQFAPASCVHVLA